MIQWILTSCVLILAVLGLRFALKGKISLRLQYALWAVVLVRLLLPFTFGESRVSAANLSRPVQPVVQQVESVEIPVQSFDSAYEEVVQEHIQQGQDVSGFEMKEELEYEAYERMEKVSLTDVLLWVWIAGMGLCFAALLVSNLHFAAKLRRSRRAIVLPDAPLPVYCAPQIATPCLFGLFRPAIYVTEEVLADPVALNHVLTHECTHFRHGDHIWSALRGLCLCVHWYNPLVWIAAKVSRSDAELACDEAAIQSLGEENRLDYGRTLIGLTCAKGVTPLLTATMMTGSKHSIKERITLIAKKQKFSAAAVIVLILALAITAGCTFTGPASNQDAPTSKYQLMAYPGTEWGMSPEALMESLELTEDDLSNISQDEYRYSFYVENKEYLGYDVTLYFLFKDPLGTLPHTPNGTGFGLEESFVIFPDDTDMQSVLRAMKREYGEPTDTNSPGINLRAKKDTQGHVVRWDSVETQAETISPIHYELSVLSEALGFKGIASEDSITTARAQVDSYLDKAAANIYWAENTLWLNYGEEREGRPSMKAITFQGNRLYTERLLFDGAPEISITIPRLPENTALQHSFTYFALGKIAELKNFHGVNIDKAKVNVELMDTEALLSNGIEEIVMYKLEILLHPENPELIPEGTPMKNGWIMADPQEGPLYYFTLISSNRDPSDTVRNLGGMTEQELIAQYGTEEMLETYGNMYNAAAHGIGYENNLLVP